ncbi:MAG: MAE_28990/MAE_18760 family HEPN-like nuclease [Cognaticolwellia sp.]
MDHFRDEYEKRKNEIEQYVSLLELLDKDGAQIKHFDSEGDSIPTNSLQVSKATFYLILYNLSEATVNAGVESIYNKVKDESLSFSDIIEKLQIVWWNSHSKSLTSTENDNLIDKIYLLHRDCQSNQVPDFNNFISGVSGNIDAESVRNVCHKYGIPVVSDGRELETTKKNRNWLSHGNKSFCDIGKDLVLSDLQTVKERTFCFLDEYVTNVSDYLAQAQYKKVI